MKIFIASPRKSPSETNVPELITWKSHLPKEEECPLACSIVWRVYGDEARAQACFHQARNRMAQENSGVC